MSLFYHTLAFQRITAEEHRAINQALLVAPVKFRKEFLGNSDFELVENQSYEELWHRIFEYTETIEAEISQIVSQYHILEWLHILRRIGVQLSSKHSGKTDATTVSLVRRIMELSIQKYSKLDEFSIQTSDAAALKSILGGELINTLITKKVRRKDAVRFASKLTKPKQWILTNFSRKQFVDCYRLEGMAYEYWQATASLRLIGKAAVINHSEPASEPLNMDELYALAQQYDDRNIKSPTKSTLSANLMDMTDIASQAVILVPMYNSTQRPASEFQPTFFSQFPPEFVPNFLLAPFDVLELRNSHDHLRGPFAKRYKYTLDDALLAILTISLFTLLPPSSLRNGATQANLLRAYETLSQRAYMISESGLDELHAFSEILIRMHSNDFSDATVSGVKDALDSMVLDETRDQFTGLWSGGKWFPIIKFDNGLMVNTVGIGEHIHRLFVGVRDQLGKKGEKFEQVFREQILRSGFKVEFHGELVFNDGTKREADCIVRHLDELYLFECRAMERPLDYDIGKPTTLARRKDDLEGKLDQVSTLENRLTKDKLGRNFDFSWANAIHSFVVSPFVEFPYANSELYFGAYGPKLLSAEEAVARLKSAESSNPTPPPPAAAPTSA